MSKERGLLGALKVLGLLRYYFMRDIFRCEIDNSERGLPAEIPDLRTSV